jgi:hypothetical protein
MSILYKKELAEQKIYEPIKEVRNLYYVEYRPPSKKSRFSTLNIILYREASKRKVAMAMEKESNIWLKIYPIPIFISSFDIKGDKISLKGIKPCDHLIAFYDKKNNLNNYWKLLKENEIPDVALNDEYINKLFSKLTYSTIKQRKESNTIRYQQIRIGSIIIFVWIVIIPVAFAIIEYSIRLVEIIVLVFCFIEAIKKGLELIGKWPKTKREKDRDEEERLKEHFYYHCIKNPEGFRKLMIENIENDEKAAIIKEVNLLKGKK